MRERFKLIFSAFADIVERWDCIDSEFFNNDQRHVGN